MNNVQNLIITALFIMGMSHMAFAVEQNGGGLDSLVQENIANTAPSDVDIRNTMKNYVTEQSKASGTFDIADSKTGKMLHLAFDKFHDQIHYSGYYYTSCAEFRDTTTGKVVDLDINVIFNGMFLSVANVRIHKVGGYVQQSYDNTGFPNTIGSPMGNIKSKKSLEGNVHSHDGNEHSGN